MKSEVKIIRTLYGTQKHDVFREIPPIPTITNQVVYVWGIENEKWLKNRGYETRLQDSKDLPDYITDKTHLYMKLVTLDLALQEFGEVMFLDWDCKILRELDSTFYGYLKQKPIQCPIYSHYKEPLESLLEYNKDPTPFYQEFYDHMNKTIKKFSWEYEDMLVIPNFGFFYSRDKTVGRKLRDVVDKHEFHGIVDEIGMFIHVDCGLDEYIEKYHPVFVKGVSDDITDTNLLISQVQRRLNKYVESKLDMDIYLKHL